MILKGNPVSPGIAVGEAYIYKAFKADVREAYFEPGLEAQQKQAFKDAVAGADVELQSIIESFDDDDEKAKIFIAHKEILFDEEILDMMEGFLQNERKMPDYAVMEAYEEFITLMEKAKDPLIAARADDFRDVRNRLIRILHGEKEKNLMKLKAPIIVVAHDLLPSDTATLDRKNVIGIITEVGSSTSHTAIIANNYRIPAVLGVCDCMRILRDGQLIGLDALTGEIHVQPDIQMKDTLLSKQAGHLKSVEKYNLYLDKPFCTQDGARFQMGLNIGNTQWNDGYQYSDFVGLFRTEFLYMESDHLPDEDEQFAAYRKVLENAKGKPVTLRTLDIGGDKSLSYMELPKEDNPFLGNRALRLCLSNPELFKTQMRAALRASIYGELWIMVPMIGSIDDIERAQAVFNGVRGELNAEGVKVSDSVKFGIMIEIPAIAMIADMVAPMVDFASIGTNDLCQYLCAVDRVNPALAEYYQPLSPAMLRMLHHVEAAFHKSGKPLSICGELAGSRHGALVLAGLGITKLSMSESNMAKVKATLANVSLEQARQLANQALRTHTQKEVFSLINQLLNKNNSSDIH